MMLEVSDHFVLTLFLRRHQDYACIDLKKCRGYRLAAAEDKILMPSESSRDALIVGTDGARTFRGTDRGTSRYQPLRLKKITTRHEIRRRSA
jgi:hypothetical protein